MGAIIVTNIIMLGALAATGWIPISKEEIGAEIINSLAPARLEQNLEALEIGFNSILGR